MALNFKRTRTMYLFPGFVAFFWATSVVFCLAWLPGSRAATPLGRITGQRTLRLEESPYDVHDELVVERDAQLTIEPGVTLRFAPGVGLTVKGALVAKGNSDQRILFTKQNYYDRPSDEEERVHWPTVRLVDGMSVVEGRLQIYYRGRWRSVCTNSRNWTIADAQVICRQLGFTGGNFSRWFERSNDSSQFMYENPNCTGMESRIDHCDNWNNRKLGNGICDYHMDIGLQCDAVLPETVARGNWRGVTFLNAQVNPRTPIRRINKHASLSLLENVNITYAGRDLWGNATSALEIIGVPPYMKAIEIRRSAYNGINATRLKDGMTIEGGIFRENRGYGIFVNASSARINFTAISVRENGADGIRYVYHDPQEYFPISNFESTPSLGNQQEYPLYRQLYHENSPENVVCQPFEIYEYGFPDMQLTVRFWNLQSSMRPDQTASTVSIEDGERRSIFEIRNDTTPQTASSVEGKLNICLTLRRGQKVKFMMEIIADIGKAYDLNLTDCNITNNNGRGVWAENIRTGLAINRTKINENWHVAGLHVDGGVGDILVNNSFFNDNIGDGFNVSYSGGRKIVNLSVIKNNTMRGLAFWFNESAPFRAFKQMTVISNSIIEENQRFGILAGNFCQIHSFWNISMNTFGSNYDDAIVIQSCWYKANNVENDIYLIDNNKFSDNLRLGVRMKPALHLHAKVSYNEFTGHKKGAILVSNQELEWLKDVPAFVNIHRNTFRDNKGTFVANIGLVEQSEVQELNFTRNWLGKNIVTEPYPSLNPRSRVAAVVTVSSSNARVFRNYFENPGSKYELGVHLELHSKTINGSHNFWGETYERDTNKIYTRIFDRKDRYNLALVKFQPYLTFSDLDTTHFISPADTFEKKMPFRVGNDIGGEVIGEEEPEIPEGTYYVRKDIFIHPKSKLILKPGVKLLFDKSVGMMVQGRLESSGELKREIMFVASRASTGTSTDVPIKLSNGTEGRLEVRVGNKWGSVCSYNWGIESAAIACQQLGLVLNPEDWMLEKSQFPQENNMNDVILSNVQCADTDINLLECKAEHVEDFEASCSSEVGLRCYSPSWSGIRFGMLADQSILKHVVIEEAGLLDYSTRVFKPALQIDFHQHHLEDIKIQKNTDCGLGIMWNNLLVSSPKVSRCTLSENRKHGIVTRSQALEVAESGFFNNAESGIHYDPMISYREQRDLVGWIVKNRKGNVRYLSEFNTGEHELMENKPLFLVVSDITTVKQLIIRAARGKYRIGVMILNPIDEESTEEIIFFNSEQESSLFWNVRQNQTEFPLLSPGYAIMMRYSPGTHPVGGIVLYLSSISALTDSSQKTQLVLNIHNNEFKKCKRGFSSNHYNWPRSSRKDYYNRYGNETIMLTNNVVSGSRKEAIFVHTPFWEPRQTSLANINYTLNANQFNNNHLGIVQYSRDIRQSNNLYQWLLNDTLFDGNIGGGMDIRLPYVWQYSENYTHTVTVDNSTFQNNNNFEFVIDGHFAKVNITRNTFRRNQCIIGLMTITGMEKEMFISENKIEYNSGEHVVEFNINSHADKFGIVKASFERNILKHNSDGAQRSLDHTSYQPKSYAISVKGIQNINISRNILQNPEMQFELLAGIYAGSLDNTLNATLNYWNLITINSTEVRKRIFDFDDWNSYSIVNFNPILGRSEVDGSSVVIPIDEQRINTREPFGGRLLVSQTLDRTSEPYVINSDLTVMPGVTLTIKAGVELAFYPSVGILVLGELIVDGSSRYPVKMRPAQHLNRKTTFFRSAPSYRNVRLCVDAFCEGGKRNNGFLEVYNQTTLQWVPVCDPRFTERNAQVVCRELDYSVLNVHYQFGSRMDLRVTELKQIRFWPEPLECSGHEKSFSDCELRLNGFGNHSYECKEGGEEFVYIACGDETNLPGEEYWGGIRFAQPHFENKMEGLFTTHRTYIPPSSTLRHLHIEGAGILHGEKMAAIQIVRREVLLEDIEIKSCASHGVETIAPPNSLFYKRVEVVDNLGTGMNIFVLGGSANNAEELPYYPLTQASLPYHIFSLVDICDTNKQLMISERVLIYYKYDNMPVDCIKIIVSNFRNQKVGFRLLHYNLFNATDYSAYPDFIKLFDGDIFNSSNNKLIGEIGVTEALRIAQPELKFYRSHQNTLSIQLHASGASGVHGFVAEVVTLPISRPKLGRDTRHNISFCELSRNILGGLIYQSAGEIAPALTIHQTRFVSNGEKLFGNFTTTDAAVLLDIQNTRDLIFRNNLLMHNQGGLYLRVASKSTSSDVQAIIINNLFTENYNREVLYIKGRHSGYYQEVEIVKNYFARNNAVHRENIVLSEIYSNFTRNLVVENKGKHQLSLLGFPEIVMSKQTCSYNWFFKNEATREGDWSTLYATSAGQSFYYNYFVNIDNNFELLAGNKSVVENDGTAFINARQNWWGFPYRTAVSGRIKDARDYEQLLLVEYEPHLENNYTVIDGNCSGGWTKIGDTCFLYVGGRMTHEEARMFCEKDNASMPYLRIKEEELMSFLRSQQDQFDRWNHAVWIRSIEVPLDECAIFQNGRVKKHGCYHSLPFLCEKDPEVVEFGASPWYRNPLTIASVTVAGVVFLFLVVCIAFSICKSRRRYREKLERRNSIRASLRSLQSAGTGYGELGYRRRLEKLGRGDAIKPTVIKVNNGSVDSISKTQISSSSMEDTRSFDFSESKVHEDDSPDFVALTNRFGHDPQLENENANAMVRPTFDLTYENHGFRDHFTPQDGSRDWSTGSNSTLDIKRSLERAREDTTKDTSTFRPTPSPPSEYQEPTIDYKNRTSTFLGSDISHSRGNVNSNRNSGDSNVIYGNVNAPSAISFSNDGNNNGTFGNTAMTPSTDNGYNHGRHSSGSYGSNGSDTYKNQYERRPLETAM